MIALLAAGGLLGTWGVVAAMVVSLYLSAFFSGSETGIMSVSRVRLRHGGIGGPRRARLLALLDRLEDPILTCLIGTNLFNVIASAIMTAVLTAQFGPRGQWLAVAVVSVLVILLGEILPKVLYREYPEKLTRTSLPGITVAMAVFWPVRWLLGGYTQLWQRLLPSDGNAAGDGLDRVSLAALLMNNNVAGQRDRRFVTALDRFLKMAHLNLGPLMRPLSELQAVSADTTVGECLAIAARSGFSRLPIRSEDDTLIQSYVMVRDLLFLPRTDHERIIPRRLWRSFLLVDVRMSPYELFEELRSQERQLAVVVDPGGNALGLITLEDLIETVIGSIHDEFDAAAGGRTGHLRHADG